MKTIALLLTGFKARIPHLQQGALIYNSPSTPDQKQQRNTGQQHARYIIPNRMAASIDPRQMLNTQTQRTGGEFAASRTRSIHMGPSSTSPDSSSAG
jgi:hypothetical protein